MPHFNVMDQVLGHPYFAVQYSNTLGKRLTEIDGLNKLSVAKVENDIVSSVNYNNENMDEWDKKQRERTRIIQDARQSYFDKYLTSESENVRANYEQALSETLDPSWDSNFGL
jgi:predicted solute-binding protein